jgi:hypothetical protein
MRHKYVKKAAMIFTDCLESSKYYDPEIRLGCLQALEGIMIEQKLIEKAPNIPMILQ